MSKRANGQKKKKKLRWGVLIVLLALVCGGFYVWQNLDTLAFRGGVAAKGDVEKNPLGGRDSINLLMLGADSADAEAGGRSDTIIAVNINLKYNKINAISIPRDSRVTLPGRQNPEKINAAFARGGIDLAKQTVEELLGINIDYYAVTDFEGFKDVIDAMGGVQIDVDRRMKYRTYNQMIDLQPGLQTLNGEQALGFVRFRHEALGDIARASRQQVFLKAVAQQLTSPESILKLPTIMPQLTKAVKTDLSMPQILALAKSFSAVDWATSITMETCPGDFLNLNGISYWGINDEELAALATSMFATVPPQIIAEQAAAAKAKADAEAAAGKTTGAPTDGKNPQEKPSKSDK